MSNELQVNLAETGKTMYAVVWDETGLAWNGSAFATYTATRGDFDVALTEIGVTGYYRGTFPGTAGNRRWEYFLQAGASPSHTADISIAKGAGHWDGTNLFPKIGAPVGASISADIAAVKTDSASILARIGAFTGSGLNTILGFLRALGAKAASLTPSDLSSGTTYDNAFDSLEAVRDNQGAGGGGDATAANQLAILAKINPARVFAVSSVTNDLEIEVHSGDDKDAGDTNSLEWTGYDQWSIFGGGALQLSYKLTSAYEAGTGSWTNIGTGTITQAGTDALIKVSLTAAETGGLATSPPNDKWHYTYRLRVTQVDLDVITVAKGAMTVTA